MSQHIFGSLLTQYGPASNNRGENEGNVSTLQKLIWNGTTHTTVSAEAIRYALREYWGERKAELLNRRMEGEGSFDWRDTTFSEPQKYIDDWVLGYMNPDKETLKRRGRLEVSRAVSISPWFGEVTFNAASPGASGKAQKGKGNPTPYAVEIHATRYQYAFALTGEEVSRKYKELTLDGLISLRRVAGNHSRFLYDFSPEVAVFRVTDDPAPRIMYCFRGEGEDYSLESVVQLLRSGDIAGEELCVGGVSPDSEIGEELLSHNVSVSQGIKKAAESVKGSIIDS